MSNFREPKPDDQEKSEKALDMLRDLIFYNDECDSVIWIGAMFALTARWYSKSGHSFENFKEEMDRMTNFYKNLWDE
jgi:hypothetical protein